jgi:para-nitrobenzyl esterase
MIRIMFRAFLISLTALAAISLPASAQVKVDGGAVSGLALEGVTAYEGIPFAAPPVGDLRWRAPQPVKPWSGVLKADRFGHDCMQKPFPGDDGPIRTESSEDCLYVNVWTPAAAKSTDKLPVMVWIYGGGYLNGGSSPAIHDGAEFARGGVVLVSFNYRLGRFGFFAHPALSAEHPDEVKGNYGYMDQIAALQWVRRNVAAFGGDPSNVTIFGESAGGDSVVTLLASPLAKGLFARAIVESGGGRGPILGGVPLKTVAGATKTSAEQIGVNFATKNGIEGTDAAALDKLRALPASVLVGDMNLMNSYLGKETYSGPMIDGRLVVESLREAFADGRWNKVSVMAGANSRDIGWVQGKTMDELLAPFAPNQKAAAAAYDPQSTGNIMAVARDMGADRMMNEPARFVVRQVAAAGQKAFYYRFSYVAEARRAKWDGAPHASEIPYVFATVPARYGDEAKPGDLAMARTVHTYWLNFAKTGDPSGGVTLPGGGALPRWEAYSTANESLMEFTNSGAEAKSDPWKDRLDLTAAVSEKK